MSWPLLLLLALFLYYLLTSTQALLSNYRKARLISPHLPIFLIPFNPLNPLYLAFSVPLLPLLERLVPSRYLPHVRKTIPGWEFRDNMAGTTLQGPGFFLVGTGSTIDFWISDVELAAAVLGRIKDFSHEAITAKILGVAGPNMMATDYEGWQRMRRLVAPLLNERIMQSVWGESCRLAREMSDHFMSQPGGETDESVDGVKRIAFRVLQEIGYGMGQAWKEDASDLQVPEGHKMTYMDALKQLTDGLLVVAFIPGYVLRSPVMPKALQKMGDAVIEFKSFTKELIGKELRRSARGEGPGNNILSLISSVTEKGSQGRDLKATTNRQYLSDPEVAGSLYQFTLAGYDTTANTMAYALTMLACEPRWQEWVIEEIDRVAAETTSHEYADVVPKLERCLAVMYETVRLYTPVGQMVRAVDKPTVITTSSGTYNIPEGVRMCVDMQNLALQKRYWGEGAHEYRPSRWIIPETEKATKASTVTQVPTLHEPAPKGAFIPWGAGPRICPGQKMAHVEFLGVFWTLFRSYRVEPVLLAGEGLSDAQMRLRECVRDSQPTLTLRMNRPKDVILRWVRR